MSATDMGHEACSKCVICLPESEYHSQSGSLWSWIQFPHLISGETVREKERKWFRRGWDWSERGEEPRARHFRRCSLSGLCKCPPFREGVSKLCALSASPSHLNLVLLKVTFSEITTHSIRRNHCLSTESSVTLFTCIWSKGIEINWSLRKMGMGCLIESKSRDSDRMNKGLELGPWREFSASHTCFNYSFQAEWLSLLQRSSILCTWEISLLFSCSLLPYLLIS